MFSTLTRLTKLSLAALLTVGLLTSVLGANRVKYAFNSIAESFRSSVDEMVGSDTVFLAELAQIQASFPEHIAELRWQISEVEADLFACRSDLRRHAHDADASLESQVPTSVAHDVRYVSDRSEHSVPCEHAHRLRSEERRLQTERDGLSTELRKVEAEHAAFLAEVSVLRRQAGAVARREKLVELSQSAGGSSVLQPSMGETVRRMRRDLEKRRVRLDVLLHMRQVASR